MAAHPETGKAMKPKHNFRRHRLTVSLTTLPLHPDDRVSVTHIKLLSQSQRVVRLSHRIFDAVIRF